MKKIFVCSPYAGDIQQNTLNAIEYCRQEIEAGNVPYAPHLFFPQILDENNLDDRMLGINLGIEIMQVCDEVHVYGTRISSGMQQEIKIANMQEIPVLFMDKALQEVMA